MVLKRARVEGRARVRAIKSVKNNWIGVMGSTREGGGGRRHAGDDERRNNRRKRRQE